MLADLWGITVETPQEWERWRMAKKKRRSRKSSAARRRTAARAAVSNATRTRRSSRSTASPKKVDFAAEYHYVLGDLRRLGILAAVMFASLVALALILR